MRFDICSGVNVQRSGWLQWHEMALCHTSRLLVNGPQRGQLLRVAFLQVAQLMNVRCHHVRGAAAGVHTELCVVRRSGGRLRLIRIAAGQLMLRRSHRRQVTKVHGMIQDGRPGRCTSATYAAATGTTAAATASGPIQPARRSR